MLSLPVLGMLLLLLALVPLLLLLQLFTFAATEFVLAPVTLSVTVPPTCGPPSAATRPVLVPLELCANGSIGLVSIWPPPAGVCAEFCTPLTPLTGPPVRCCIAALLSVNSSFTQTNDVVVSVANGVSSWSRVLGVEWDVR